MSFVALVIQALRSAVLQALYKQYMCCGAKLCNESYLILCNGSIRSTISVRAMVTQGELYPLLLGLYKEYYIMCLHGYEGVLVMQGL